MDEAGLTARQIVAELADRFEERQTFDVADRAADLAQHEVDVIAAGEHEILDGVGDVRDDLHRAAEIVAAALLGENVLIDAAGGDVVALGRVDAGEALIVAEVEVGLRPVVGHVDLAVLIGAHGARIDVEIRIQLAQADLVSARLKERTKRCGGQSLAEGRDDPARDEDVSCHGPTPYMSSERFGGGHWAHPREIS